MRKSDFSSERKHFTSSFNSQRRVTTRAGDSHRTSVYKKRVENVWMLFLHTSSWKDGSKIHGTWLRLQFFTQMFSISSILQAKVYLCMMQCCQQIVVLILWIYARSCCCCSFCLSLKQLHQWIHRHTILTVTPILALWNCHHFKKKSSFACWHPRISSTTSSFLISRYCSYTSRSTLSEIELIHQSEMEIAVQI